MLEAYLGMFRVLPLALLILWGCDAQKRMRRHVDRAVRLTSPIQVKDYLLTVYNIPTEVIQVPVGAETAYVSIPVPITTHDTVVMEKERVRLEVKRDTTRIYVRAICKPETVSVQKVEYMRVPVYSEVKDNKKLTRRAFFNGMIWGVVLLLIFFAIVYIITYRKR